MHLRISAVLTLFVCGLAVQASAEEYCVSCSGPDARYRCIIGGDASLAASTSRGQLLCITELAQTGNHESCSVGRTTAEPCEGEPRTVMFTGAAEAALPPIGGPPPEAPYPAADSPALAEGQDAPPDAPAESPPQTVEELAKQTAKSTGEGLEKAGDAVGDTAKSTGEAVGNAVSKTWKCMTSLFSDC